uniref:Uncharacterized protein n=1 Tax=Nelumbo nucifera TaxID=4432 RepID=A0A822XNA9_NELNU|nr:TPA_asm: hypothetical protein HUJ06_023210 [Nelumbo nucifera]
MCSPSKRRDMDVMKLMMTDHKVETVKDSVSEFIVEFNGPPNSKMEKRFAFGFPPFPFLLL